ncbi:ABC transporter-associated protein EcsC [Bacillus pseudomycoides]|uniref:ABC transporter-associated protein EcsC n=1 Tax=Bacillus pseudomycoides TaxID=64104 RepID=A0AA91ZTE2_9BACI|nr:MULTISPECIES: EcsC family protein [Bacillus]PEB47809.1 ABC transporter-associated protein EcsC [Bacillus sp. AFS098217]PED82676.1 ABC transporter-associated protein EcsC [Bacillus pseudomycoides]PEU12726.1 ABC transporter-associated protein EcsC [Bacillus sp. AFS014408]PEU13685.1 ABC transporter-associated protein EcsC [Bacillus sp. AFS019443]PFW60116.1 ABC transporter-associated protein EcsC [Bacillus sp. AFS075034]
MTDYEKKVIKEVQQWKLTIMKNSSMMTRLSKKVQTKVQQLIPEKVQNVLTETIKKMVQGISIGSNFIRPKLKETDWSLQRRDEEVMKKMDEYKKIGAAEGAGTGAGGFLLGLADFPLLLSIKIKFLFDAATVYGFDTSKEEERLFILHVFQLAFSSDDHRKQIWKAIETWDTQKENHMDWEKFQQEYRDYIDLAKMLQLVPVIGAPVGAYANYQLLQRLGETTMNCYRMRLLQQKGVSI